MTETRRTTMIGRSGLDSEYHLVRAIRFQVLPLLLQEQKFGRSTALSPAAPHMVVDPASIDPSHDNVSDHTETASSLAAAPAIDHLDDAFVARVLGLLLDGDIGRCRETLGEALKSGSSPNDIIMRLLTPAARDAGTRWQRDESSFTDVTLVLSALSAITEDLHADDMANKAVANNGAAPVCVLWTPAEDKHIYGHQVFASLLRSQGWCVKSLIGVSIDSACQVLEERPFAFFGFSIGCTIRPEVIRRWTQLVRKASFNQHIKVLLGGPLLDETTCDADACGVDFSSSDGSAAMQFVGGLAPTWLSRPK